jgi:hypothetical protein
MQWMHAAMFSAVVLVAACKDKQPSAPVSAPPAAGSAGSGPGSGSSIVPAPAAPGEATSPTTPPAAPGSDAAPDDGGVVAPSDASKADRILDQKRRALEHMRPGHFTKSRFERK